MRLNSICSSVSLLCVPSWVPISSVSPLNGSLFDLLHQNSFGDGRIIK